MIQTGIDQIEIERIRKTWQNHGARFLDRVYTKAEQQYCLSRPKPEESFAARWAGKEAVMKALGLGMFGGVHYTGIEILNHPTGKPYVVCTGKPAKLLGKDQLSISLTHSEGVAQAVAVRLDARLAALVSE